MELNSRFGSVADAFRQHTGDAAAELVVAYGALMTEREFACVLLSPWLL